MSLPDPLVPHEADISDFKFMPLEVGRLLRSEFWITAIETNPLVAAVSVNLWAEAWHQRPAGSVPDSDVVLSRMAMVTRATWATIREEVMGAWTLCSDGRWYHPVVAEKALEAWSEKTAYRERKAKWAEAGRKGGQNRAKNVAPAHGEDGAEAAPSATDEATLEATVKPSSSLASSERDRDRDRDSVKGEGEGQGFNKKDISSDPEGPDQPALVKEASYPKDFTAFWEVYPRREGKGAALKAWQGAKKIASVETIMAGVAVYADRCKLVDDRFVKQPATWLNQRCWDDQPASKPQSRGGYVPMGPAGG